MSKAVGTKGSFASQAGHAKLRKYQIKTWGYQNGPIRWGARVPYGSWNGFETWAEACAWLEMKHGQRVAKARRESERRA